MNMLKVNADGVAAPASRIVPEEVPVAIVHDGTTHAVMMATPADIEDFAVGFSVSEGVVERLEQIAGIEIVTGEEGVEARMWLAPDAGRAAIERRRRIVGPTGCGLCGVDSLVEARRPARQVADGSVVAPATVLAAVRATAAGQTQGAATRAMHAASFCDGDGRLIALREDVGRHNALDKLIGHVLRNGLQTESGVTVITSRVSIEMVQKAAILGAPVLVAVSAPTALAVETAEAAGLTLCAVARDDGFEVFTRPDRIALRILAP